MTSIANLTPTSPVTLPWTYVTNGGQAYSLSSAQGAGCVDTATPLTANVGGIYNVKGVPLYPSQVYAVIAQADQQYGPVIIACQSLVNQLPSSSSGVPSSSIPDLFGYSISSNALWDDIGGIVVVVIILTILYVFVEWAMSKRKRR